LAAIFPLIPLFSIYCKQNSIIFQRIDNGADGKIYFQAHASPEVYSRAFLYGGLAKEKLERNKIRKGTYLLSYPSTNTKILEISYCFNRASQH